jgi:hypothetical protein
LAANLKSALCFQTATSRLRSLNRRRRDNRTQVCGVVNGTSPEDQRSGPRKKSRLNGRDAFLEPDCHYELLKAAGFGDAIQRRLCSRHLSRHVIAYTSARLCDGGGGAVYILLRS